MTGSVKRVAQHMRGGSAASSRYTARMQVVITRNMRKVRFGSSSVLLSIVCLCFVVHGCNCVHDVLATCRFQLVPHGCLKCGIFVLIPDSGVLLQ